MKEASYIELVFENLESIIIPVEHLRKLECGPLTSKNKIDVYETNSVHLQINYQDKSDLNYDAANDEEPLGMYLDNPTSNRVQDRRTFWVET